MAEDKESPSISIYLFKLDKEYIKWTPVFLEIANLRFCRDSENISKIVVDCKGTSLLTSVLTENSKFKLTSATFVQWQDGNSELYGTKFSTEENAKEFIKYFNEYTLIDSTENKMLNCEKTSEDYVKIGQMKQQSVDALSFNTSSSENENLMPTRKFSDIKTYSLSDLKQKEIQENELTEFEEMEIEAIKYEIESLKTEKIVLMNELSTSNENLSEWKLAAKTSQENLSNLFCFLLKLSYALEQWLLVIKKSKENRTNYQKLSSDVQHTIERLLKKFQTKLNIKTLGSLMENILQ